MPRRQVERIARALSDPRRFAILERIAAAQRVGCMNLRSSIPIAPATLSHHLKELETSGLVRISREGKFATIDFCRDVWAAYLAELHKL